jgi:hypothetical protein
MERAHALRMEKLRQDRAKLPEDFPFDRKASAKPDDDTVDIP